MIKRFFSTNRNHNSKSNTAVARPGRPSSPPPNIYADYINSNASALGSNFFANTVALPQTGNGPNGYNDNYTPTGYLNGNGVTANNGDSPAHHYSSSASSVNGSLNHSYMSSSYLNSVPASSVNGSDNTSLYGGSTLGHISGVSDAGLKNIPLPPAASIMNPSGPANGQQYPPQGGPGMNSYHTGYNGPSGSSPYPPRQPPINQQQQQQHQALPNRGRRPVHPASAGLQAVPEQRTPISTLLSQQVQNMLSPNQRPVHVKVLAADIRETTYMLRQLYKMELQIYSERYAVDRTQPQELRREEMRRKVDLLRDEIEDIINTWSITDAAGWTSEELQHVQYSLKVVSNLRTMGAEVEKK